MATILDELDRREAGRGVPLPVRAVIALYDERTPTLYGYTKRDGARVFGDSHGDPCRALNSWAAAFWAGYDGMTKGVRVPPRGIPLRAWYDAGRIVAELEAAAVPTTPTRLVEWLDQVAGAPS